MKRIAFLTSSRADYGIYNPLLKKLKEYSTFEVKIIVFGTHLSPFHGYTLSQIISDGFKVDYEIETVISGDSPSTISTSMGLTTLKFAEFWKEHKVDFDLVFCLGDRYEMFAAVIAGVPFGINFAHLHGGERTLGAIDNIFRNSITLASKYHFVSCDAHAKRVFELIESEKNIFNIGSLSLDNLENVDYFSFQEFSNRFELDLNKPTILVTVHPETVSIEKNVTNIEEISRALENLKKYQVIITLPNADTCGNVIRKRILQLVSENQRRIFCFENLGKKGYFTTLKYCAFLIGNTSSGIIEAASFNKWVIDLGVRQLGRERSKNTFNIPFDHETIVSKVKEIEKMPVYDGGNIYYKSNPVNNICSILINNI